MTSRPEKGDTAPSLCLPTEPAGEIDLGRPSGDAHIVYFYPKDNTPGCTTEAQDFSALKDAFEALNVAIIGVSKDSLTKHGNFIAKQSINFPLASDQDADACEKFGVWVEKNMYGRKFMGIERTTFLILADGTIAQIWRKVKVKGHAEKVLDETKTIISEK